MVTQNPRYTTEYTDVTGVPSSLLTQNNLHEAFKWFQEASVDLCESYSQLQSKADELNQALARASAQQLQALKEKERLADQLQHLLSLLPLGVIILNSHGIITQANPAAISILSISHKKISLEGLLWRDLIAQVFKPDGVDGHEMILVNGRKVNVTLISLETEPKQMILISDLTETRALQAQVSRSERLLAMGRMASVLAHQIRTPISAALLYTENMVKRTLTTLQYQKFSSKIFHQLHHVEYLVKDMLLFAHGDISLSDQIQLEDLIRQIQVNVEAALQQYSATLKLDFPSVLKKIYIHCHTLSLVSAIQNLINNALEASNPGAVIELKISCLEEKFIKIKIIDQGLGLPQLPFESLTEPFMSTKANGTGLGLAVVCAVIKAHGGQFILKNNESSQGVCAEIRLPFYRYSGENYDAM